MANDKFYRDMTDTTIVAAYDLMKQNHKADPDFWEKEKSLLENVMLERGIVLEDDSISRKISVTKGFVELMMDTKHKRKYDDGIFKHVTGQLRNEINNGKG